MPAVTNRGLALPRFRIGTDLIQNRWGGATGGVETRAIQAKDDDTTTLGIRAGRDALGGSRVDGLFFAVTTATHQYGSVSPFLAEQLGFDETVVTQTFSGTTRAGTAALRAAQEAVASGLEGALVVASQSPTPEPGTDREKTAGAGAAALLVEAAEGLRHCSSASRTRAVLDKWQAPGEQTRHTADDRYAREVGYVETTARAVEDALDSADWSSADVDVLAVSQPNPRYMRELAGAIGVGDETIAVPEFATDHGDLGAASAIAVLASAELEPEQRVIVAGYGTGMADAFAFEVTEVPDDASSPDDDPVWLEYVDQLEHTGQL